VGLEVEYGGIGVKETVPLLERLFGARVLEEDPTEAQVWIDPWGVFRVEIDSTLLKDQRILQFFGLEDDSLGAQRSTFVETLEETIVRVAGGVVPHELIT